MNSDGGKGGKRSQGIGISSTLMSSQRLVVKRVRAGVRKRVIRGFYGKDDSGLRAIPGGGGQFPGLSEPRRTLPAARESASPPVSVGRATLQEGDRTEDEVRSSSSIHGW